MDQDYIGRRRRRFISYALTKNGKAIAKVAKTGSSAICKHLLVHDCPEKMPKFGGADPSDGPGWQSAVPSSTQPDVEEILIPMRDPIARFADAVFQMGRHMDRPVSVDTVLERLEREEERTLSNYHLLRVVDYLIEGKKNRIFIFPKHFGEMSKAAGMPSDVPFVYRTPEGSAPILTDEQISRAAEFYAEDVALFATIKEVGQVV